MAAPATLSTASTAQLPKEAKSEEADEDSEEESGGNMLLCLYDKVHRVRNKWRCQFKDAVLKVYGREFCLNRLNGEFEW